MSATKLLREMTIKKGWESPKGEGREWIIAPSRLADKASTLGGKPVPPVGTEAPAGLTAARARSRQVP